MTRESKSSAARIFLLIGRLILAGIFLFAAYAKLKPQTTVPWSASSVKISLSMFALQVDSYQLLPVKLVSPVAHLLPPGELFLGLWLLTGIALRFSSLAASLLIGGFFSVVVRTYAMGLEINCGCFGPGERLGVGTIVRDASLLALALAVTIVAFWIRSRGEPSSSSALPAPQRAD
ncbi:MAG TPA: MauE/DoxX family redox-associated membrane protein [Verrucomicrobiae bacterium]|nr:MauE/DoxX family redox-associated membrane protein [Verrucomicrobiae bacterium]